MPSRTRGPNHFIDSLLAGDGPLAKQKMHYTERPEQLEMAHAVERTLTEKGVLLCDAPTGTGKSIVMWNLV